MQSKRDVWRGPDKVSGESGKKTRGSQKAPHGNPCVALYGLAEIYPFWVAESNLVVAESYAPKKLLQDIPILSGLKSTQGSNIVSYK